MFEQCQCNVRGVPRFSYELADFFWKFPNEFTMIRMRYRCKIIEDGNQPVQGRIDWQYGIKVQDFYRVNFYQIIVHFRQVAEGTRDRAEMLLG